MTLTSISKAKHKARADALELEGSQALEATKRGISPKAAELLTRANEERLKAGLIRGGKLMKK
jgi:hypothetical protein